MWRTLAALVVALAASPAGADPAAPDAEAALDRGAALAAALAPRPPAEEAPLLAQVLAQVAPAGPAAQVPAAPAAPAAAEGVLARGSTTPRSAAARFAEVHNVLDYGCVGDGKADDSRCVQAAADAASRAGGGTVFFPAGTYRITQQARLTPREPYGVLLRGHTRLLGLGPASVLRMTGVKPGAWGSATDFHMFMIADGAELVTFEALRFQGENQPFSYTSNDQSSAIITATAGRTSDIVVRGCVFEHLHGFGFADRSRSTRHVVTGNIFRFVGNSAVNTGPGEAIVSNNVLYQCEGIEMGSHRSQVVNNVLVQSFGGISIGGLTGKRREAPESTAEANIVQGNVITDSTFPTAIAVSDGARDCIITNNVIARIKPAKPGQATGINVVSSGYQPVARNYVAGNVLRSIGEKGKPNAAILIAGSDENFVAFNRIADDPMDKGYETFAGIYVDRGKGNVLLGNDIASSTRDIYLKGSVDVRVIANSTRGPGGFFADPDSTVSPEVVVAPWQHRGAELGFYGAKPVARPRVTGSRAGGEALADLLAKLAALGLINDGTTR